MENAEDLRAAVKALRERANLSVREIASRLGMSPSGYSHYEQRIKDTYLPPRIATQMADVLEKAGVPRSEVLALSSPGTPPMVSGFEEQGLEGFPERPLVSVFDIEAQAGNGLVPAAYEAVVDQLAFPPEYLRSITTTTMDKIAIIGVVGASMQPTLNHGDIVMVDMTKTDIDFDGMFVIRIGEALKVKRVNWGPRRQSVIVRSDNANKIQFPDEEYFENDDVNVIGRVVWVGAKQP